MTMTLTLEQPTPRQRMTEDEFDAWRGESGRVEFVDGEVIVMSPVLAVHDSAFHFLAKLLGIFLELRPIGRVCGPEFQVRLRQGLRRVPDLLFIASARLDLVKRSYLDGAPDAAFEIVSDDSVERDWREKFHEYQACGVSEYWIIDPAHQTVRLYQLRDGRYEEVAAQDGRLSSTAISGFWLKTEWLWREPPPGALACLREMGLIA
ncbi:MAG: Uma2 family endonuclease [Actinomycetota bacterium]